MAMNSRFVNEPDHRKRLDRQGALLSRDSEAIDVVLAAAPFLALLFNLVIGPLSVIVVIATVAGFGILRYERVVRVLHRNLPLLLLPLFCIVSVLWSAAPGATLRYGFLYLVTVIAALIIGSGTRPLAALKAIQIAFTVYLVAALIFGRWVVWQQDGVYAFAGLAGSKNAAGDVAGVGLIVSTVCTWWAISQRRMRWVAAAGMTVPVALYCLIAAKSTGAILATGLAVAGCVPWLISRSFSPSVRTTIFFATAFVGLLVLATTPLWMEIVFQSLLTQSGKGQDLTGRVDLWRVADAYLSMNPFLGIGYSAFWTPQNLDAVSLWRLLGIPIGNPFNFHNTFRAVGVEIGLVGLIFYSLVWLYCVLRLFWNAIIYPAFLSIFFCAIVAFVLPRLYFEQVGFSNMHMSTLLLFGALSYALKVQPAKVR